jgi:RNA polymerase sigma-70 factor (ECF subfamily)
MLDDTAQQVFLVALTRASDIIQGKERSFLFSTAVRVAAIARRKRRIDHERSPELPELLSDTLDPEQLADQKEALETLENVVAALPEDLRAVFVLFELEGLTTPEIAAAMGIRVGTAASRLRRAREEFHAIIKRERARQGTP